MPSRSDASLQKADMLYRAAAECHRQHTRYSRLVERSASDDEQWAALEMAYLCDDHLGTAITGYEKAASKIAANAGAHEEDAWWHKGNMLWHASREYIRRHANCDGLAKRLGKESPNRLGALAMEFDLDASALLSLRMAADAYRGVRPEAE
ncbi:MAG: hypothetical protein ABIR58_03990 [Gemmatimonadaceae bacterium]